jgi:ABC-type Fe3+/spermidine/putrescine transport system ATPase subunit
MAASSSWRRPMSSTSSRKNSFVAQFIGENNTLMGKVEKIDKDLAVVSSTMAR